MSIHGTLSRAAANTCVLCDDYTSPLASVVAASHASNAPLTVRFSILLNERFTLDRISILSRTRFSQVPNAPESAPCVIFFKARLCVAQRHKLNAKRGASSFRKNRFYHDSLVFNLLVIL